MAVGKHRQIWPKAFTALLCTSALLVVVFALRPFVLDELSLRRLTSGSESVRKEAADWLAKRRCVRAIPALLSIAKGARSDFVGVLPRYAALAMDKLLCPDAAQVVKALHVDPRWDAWGIQAALDCGDRSDVTLDAIAQGVGHEHLGIAPPSALAAFGKRAVPPLLGAFQKGGSGGSDLEHIWSHCVCLSLSAIGPAARDAIPELLREIVRSPLDRTEWQRRDEVIDPQSAAAFALWSLGEDMIEVDGAILESPNADDRAGAARRLGLFLAPDPKRTTTAESLARLSRLPEQSGRVRAVVQFLEDGSKSDGLLSAGREALSDAADDVRKAFLSVLAEIDAGPAALTEELLSHLLTGDDETRVLAARVLLRIEGQRDTALSVLLEFAAAEGIIAIGAIDALGEVMNDTGAARSLLERLLGATEPAVRARAAVALARLDPTAGMRTALKALFAWLEAEDDQMHTAAAEALCSFPMNPAVVSLLTERLFGGDREVRSYAVVLLLRAGVSDGPAIAALRSSIATPGDDIAPLAAFALHVLGDDSDEVILRAFSERSRPVLTLLTDTLSRAEPSTLDLQAYLSLRCWPEANRAWQRAANGAFLWNRLAIRSAPLPLSLARLARDSRGNASMRLRAALAAASSGPAAVDLVPALLDAASIWGGPGVLLDALARIGPVCVPHLIKELEKPMSFELRAVLVLALGRMGAAASAAAPTISRLLNNPEPAVSITAARALARIERSVKCPDGCSPILRQYGTPLLRHAADAASQIHGSLCARKQ